VGQYIARKRLPAVHGNHLELQAITEIYSRPVEIYAIDESMQFNFILLIIHSQIH
jgi:hypothetical protein